MEYSSFRVGAGEVHRCGHTSARPDILLLGGWGGKIHGYKNFIEGLAVEGLVWGVDFPRSLIPTEVVTSRVDYLKNVLIQMELDKVHVVAHSMGGVVGREFAGDDRVRGGVIWNSVNDTLGVSEIMKRWWRSGVRRVENGMEGEEGLVRRKRSDEIFEFFRFHLSSLGTSTREVLSMARVKEPTDQSLKLIFMQSSDDDLFPHSQSEYVLRMSEQGGRFIAHDMGHNCLYTQPTRSAQITRLHLDSI